MGDTRKNGTPKPVYYRPSDLSAKELTQYFQFTPSLTDEQLNVVRKWYEKNTTNFAIVDDDYIFFTLKTDRDKFVEFWTTYTNIDAVDKI